MFYPYPHTPWYITSPWILGQVGEYDVVCSNIIKGHNKSLKKFTH
jgi:hypothetical protein